MLGRAPNQDQLNLFRSSLKEILNPKHSLVLLACAIRWNELEISFSSLYSQRGCPAKPIRQMVGLTMLKHLYDFSDERLIEEWLRDPYMQFFSGESHFQWNPPCDSSDMTYFRKRLGEEGVEKLLALTVALHGEKAVKKKMLLVDTTVQEKNITFPTDTKLHVKIISGCLKIAKKAGVKLRQSYRRVVTKLLYLQRYAHRPKWAAKAKKAAKRLKTIAGRQCRNLVLRLKEIGKESVYQAKTLLFEKMLAQKKDSKNKIYSFHEPAVSCIAKGKVGKKYEFGSKVSIAVVPESNIVVGVQSYTGNPHDSKTVPKTLQQVKKVTGHCFKQVIVDRGYRGLTTVEGSQVLLPSNKTMTANEKAKKRKQQRRRSAVEAVISHLKQTHRMGLNRLKGVVGDQINALLAAIGFNLRQMIRKMETNWLLTMGSPVKAFARS